MYTHTHRGFLPELGGNGGFVVIGGKLGFNTFLFTILCVVAFGILTINKCRIGHTAMGGPQGVREREREEEEEDEEEEEEEGLSKADAVNEEEACCIHGI